MSHDLDILLILARTRTVAGHRVGTITRIGAIQTTVNSVKLVLSCKPDEVIPPLIVVDCVDLVLVIPAFVREN